MEAPRILSSFDTAGRNGGRYQGKQQDVLLTQNFKPINHLQAAKWMMAAMKSAAQETKHFTTGGSTASMAMVTPDGWLTYANVGDSPIWIVVRDGKTGEVRINNIANDHSLDNPKELVRILCGGGRIGVRNEVGLPPYRYVKKAGASAEDQSGHGLTMARAFGDKNIQGISDVADMRLMDMNRLFASQSTDAPPNRVWVVVASDGLLECSQSPEGQARLKSCSQTNPLVSADTHARSLAQNLAHAAMDNGSNDNIAVTAIEVAPSNSRRHSTHSSLLAVMDGHGVAGREVADRLKSSFERALNQAHFFPITRVVRGQRLAGHAMR